MSYVILYHPKVVEEDWPRLDSSVRTRIRRAIEQRLTMEPTYYGEPLRHHWKGHWKLRVGDYRVIYAVLELRVLVVVIGHRKDVYSTSLSRLTGLHCLA